MASSFAWLDYCESERCKALDVIQAFGDRGTLDELGIGTTRDALSDHLLPGTSTIQTRAKYHLFFRWMYLKLARQLQMDLASPRFQEWKSLTRVRVRD